VDISVSKLFLPLISKENRIMANETQPLARLKEQWDMEMKAWLAQFSSIKQEAEQKLRALDSSAPILEMVEQYACLCSCSLLTYPYPAPREEPEKQIEISKRENIERIKKMKQIVDANLNAPRQLLTNLSYERNIARAIELVPDNLKTPAFSKGVLERFKNLPFDKWIPQLPASAMDAEFCLLVTDKDSSMLAVMPEDLKSPEILQRERERQEQERQERERQEQEHLLKGGQLLAAAKHEEAIAEFKEALAINANNAEAQFGLGQAYKSSKESAPLALQHYEAAVRFNPEGTHDGASYYAFLADAYMENKKWDKAINAYGYSLKQAPNGQAYYMRGYAYVQEGKYSNAELDFNKALEMDPNNNAALSMLLICRDKKKEEQETHQQEATPASLNKWRIVSKACLLLVLLAFFMPVVGEKGFGINISFTGFNFMEKCFDGADFARKLGADEAENILLAGIALLAILVSAIGGIALGVALFYKEFPKAIDWILWGVGAFCVLMIGVSIGEEGRSVLQSGAYFCLVGTLLSGIFLCIPEPADEGSVK
jgi:tetratricopeptide (TPR) repeat protein